MKALIKNVLLFVMFLMAVAIISSTSGTGYIIGDNAEDFSLKNVDGKMVSMADYKSSKGFIIIFTCNTCPYSKMYEDRIIALHEKYSIKGYPVIAINPNDPVRQPGDSFDKMVARSKYKSFPFPYLADEAQNVTREYGASKTPHVFVLNKEKGKNIVRYIGAIDNNNINAEEADKRYVEQAVDQLLKGGKVFVNYTKAIGCTIKWKEI
jgi:peroxiredoxin